ncbi:MAG TPA: helix-turn-helix domain-containing protein [Gammaproteobacteria bacterium]|nr:helix-turn-helix domain-containing protein [Gammaproteobacteria bacterium]
MTDAASIPEQPRVTASTMLVAARESLSLSQEDIAKELYLTPAFIRYIDEDRIDEIAKKAFVKGYLRSYAKLVKLDADEVVLLFEADSKPTVRSSDFRKAPKDVVSPRYFTGPVFQTGIIGLVALLIVIMMVWFYSSRNEQTSFDTTQQESAPQEPALLREGSALTAEDSPAGAVDQDRSVDTGNDLAVFSSGNAPNVPDESTLLESDDSSLIRGVSETSTETSTETLTETPAEDGIGASTESVILAQGENIGPTELDTRVIEIDPDLVSIERETVGGINYITVEAGGEDSLKFVFIDECWLEIEDGNGNAIFADLGRFGDELIVFGTAPFEVLFGKAPAVTMEFNGRYIDLARRTASDDTAKVRVGI